MGAHLEELGVEFEWFGLTDAKTFLQTTGSTARALQGVIGVSVPGTFYDNPHHWLLGTLLGRKGVAQLGEADEHVEFLVHYGEEDKAESRLLKGSDSRSFFPFAVDLGARASMEADMYPGRAGAAGTSRRAAAAVGSVARRAPVRPLLIPEKVPPDTGAPDTGAPSKSRHGGGRLATVQDLPPRDRAAMAAEGRQERQQQRKPCPPPPMRPLMLPETPVLHGHSLETTLEPPSATSRCASQQHASPASLPLSGRSELAGIGVYGRIRIDDGDDMPWDLGHGSSDDGDDSGDSGDDEASSDGAASSQPLGHTARLKVSTSPDPTPAHGRARPRPRRAPPPFQAAAPGETAAGVSVDVLGNMAAKLHLGAYESCEEDDESGASTSSASPKTTGVKARSLKLTSPVPLPPPHHPPTHRLCPNLDT